MAILEQNISGKEMLIRYSKGKQDVNAYRKAFGLPPETLKQQLAREKRIAELDTMFNKTWLFVDHPLVEWNCKGFLGYKNKTK